MGATGLEHPPKSSGNTGGSGSGGAESGALRGGSGTGAAPATLPTAPGATAPATTAGGGGDADLAGRLAAALDALPPEDRRAIAEHVEALARLSNAKRAAVLTLTREG